MQELTPLSFAFWYAETSLCGGSFSEDKLPFLLLVIINRFFLTLTSTKKCDDSFISARIPAYSHPENHPYSFSFHQNSSLVSFIFSNLFNLSQEV